mgnify:CR=1 FL=1
MTKETVGCRVVKLLMRIVMAIVINLRLYNLFWSLIGLIVPKKGVAWLSDANHEEGGKYYAKYIIEVVNRYGIKPSRAMDYGCGYGRVAKYISPHVNELICADVSSTYLIRAKSYLKGLSNVRYLRVNGKDLREIQDESLDLVYSIGVFVHVNRKDAVKLASEVLRILKPNGLFIVELPNPSSYWPSFERYAPSDINEFVKGFRILEEGQGQTIVRLVLQKP